MGECARESRNSPDFAHDKDILALDDALVEGALEALAHFGLVAVAVRAVNQAVAHLEGVVDAFGDFAWRGLPSACGIVS